jgi:hypothetical protein
VPGPPPVAIRVPAAFGLARSGFGKSYLKSVNACDAFQDFDRRSETATLRKTFFNLCQMIRRDLGFGSHVFRPGVTPTAHEPERGTTPHPRGGAREDVVRVNRSARMYHPYHCTASSGSPRNGAWLRGLWGVGK